MHDARPPRTADAGDARRVGQHRGRQRAGRVAGAGVRHHARGLVDHEDVLVLEDDSERDRLGGHPIGRRRRELRRDPLAGAQAMRRLRGGPVHSHGAVVDQSANARPGHLGEPRREPLVEPCPALGPAHGGVEPLPTAAHRMSPADQTTVQR